MKALIATLFLAISINTSARSPFIPGDTTINLNGAIELGVSRYPSIKARQARKEATEANVKVARANYLPKLLLQEQVNYGSANSVTGTFWPNEGYAIPASGAIRPDQIWTGVFGQYTTLALNGPITSFGKIGKQVQAAKLIVAESDYAYANEIFQHKVKIADAYLRLLTLQQFVIVEESNLNRAIELQKAIDARVNSGLRPGVDSARVHAEVSKAKLNLLDILRRERSANMVLAELTGLEGVILKVDTMAFTTSLPVSIPDNAPLDIQQNPFIKYSQARWLAAAGQSEVSKIAWRPTLSFLAAGIGRGSGISNNSDAYSRNFSQGTSWSRYNYLFAVHMLWNILDFTKTKHIYHVQKSEAEALQQEYETTRLEASRHLQDAKLQLSVSYEQAHEAPVQLAAARSAFDQAQSRYVSGLGTLPELSENLLLLNRAEADLVIAYNNVWLSYLNVAASSGAIELFLNQLTTR